jgi:hypothetical protein
MEMIQELLAQVDLASMASIGAFVMVLISTLKKTPKVKDWVAGKEPFLALLLPVALAVGSKWAGLGFAEDHWMMVVVAALVAGLGAQVAHDKALPLINGVLSGMSGGAKSVTPKK